MDKILVDFNVRTENILQKTHYSIVPTFQYSRIEANTPASKNIYFIQPVVEIPSRIFMNLELNAEEKSLLDHIRTDLAAFGKERGKLVPILQLIQDKLSYLPAQAIHLVADHLDISSSEVYGVATFYNQFRFNPPGRNPVKVCLGTACHVKGGDIILENFERKLEIKQGETTADREFSIDRVACVGCCALAPVTIVGETVHGHMQPSKVEGLVLRARIEREKQQREGQENEPGR